MQYHMRRLVEMIKDIDGFKEIYDNITLKLKPKGEYCYGKRKRILQRRNYWNGTED